MPPTTESLPNVNVISSTEPAARRGWPTRLTAGTPAAEYPPPGSAATITAESLTQLSPPRLRRRPLLIAVGVLLIVVSAIVASYVVSIVKDTVQVVAALDTIPRGSLIERIDLTTVEIRPDPLLKTIPATDLDSLVGRRAAADIPAGVIVAPGAVTDRLPPESGQAIVGVALTVDQMPATRPRHGQPITFVTTPESGADVTKISPIEIPAIVLEYTGFSDQGWLVIDVTVPKDQAATVASLAAAGRLAAYWDAE